MSRIISFCIKVLMTFVGLPIIYILSLSKVFNEALYLMMVIFKINDKSDEMQEILRTLSDENENINNIDENEDDRKVSILDFPIYNIDTYTPFVRMLCVQIVTRCIYSFIDGESPPSVLGGNIYKLHDNIVVFSEAEVEEVEQYGLSGNVTVFSEIEVEEVERYKFIFDLVINNVLSSNYNRTILSIYLFISICLFSSMSYSFLYYLNIFT